MRFASQVDVRLSWPVWYFYHVRFMVHYFLHRPANKYPQPFPTVSGIDKSKALHHVLREGFQHLGSNSSVRLVSPFLDT